MRDKNHLGRWPKRKVELAMPLWQNLILRIMSYHHHKELDTIRSTYRDPVKTYLHWEDAKCPDLLQCYRLTGKCETSWFWCSLEWCLRSVINQNKTSLLDFSISYLAESIHIWDIWCKFNGYPFASYSFVKKAYAKRACLILHRGRQNFSLLNVLLICIGKFASSYLYSVSRGQWDASSTSRFSRALAPKQTEIPFCSHKESRSISSQPLNWSDYGLSHLCRYLVLGEL